MTRPNWTLATKNRTSSPTNTTCLPNVPRDIFPKCYGSSAKKYSFPSLNGTYAPTKTTTPRNSSQFLPITLHYIPHHDTYSQTFGILLRKDHFDPEYMPLALTNTDCLTKMWHIPPERPLLAPKRWHLLPETPAFSHIPHLFPPT